MKDFKFSLVIVYAVLILWGIGTVFPFLWVLNSSFKESNEILDNSFAVASSFMTDNYTKIINDETKPLGKAYANSLIISSSVCVVVVLCAGVMAFGMTRYKFRGSNILYSLIIAAQMFPAFSTIIPNFKTIMMFGLRNNIGSVILVQIAGNMAFASIILISYMRTLPVDLEEAAFIEGCNVFQILGKVVFPITIPAFATVSIFTFIWSYNDLLSQIFFLRDKRTGYTINRLLNEISSKEGTDYGKMAASVVLIVAPVLIVYFILQKNIIKGLTAGAVKG